MRQNNVLEDVYGSLTAKLEYAFFEEFLLFANSVHLLIEFLHFGGVGEGLIDDIVLGGGEFIAGRLLEGSDTIAIIMRLIHKGNVSLRIRHAQVREQLEVDKAEQRDVELSEGAHDLKVDIKGDTLVELVRRDPGNRLSHNLDTVVDTLNREERFGEVLRDRAIEKEVAVEIPTRRKCLLVNLECLVLGELGKERDHAECIVQITQSIDERRVAVFDDRAQCVLGGLLDVGLGDLEFASTQPFFVFSEMSFYFSELLNESVVLQELNILDMEVGFGVSLKLFLGLTRVNTLKDADAPKVLETQLQTPNSIASCKILTSFALFTGLNSSTHLFLFNYIEV